MQFEERRRPTTGPETKLWPLFPREAAVHPVCRFELETVPLELTYRVEDMNVYRVLALGTQAWRHARSQFALLRESL